MAAYNQQLTVGGTVLSALATVLATCAAFSSARSSRQALKASEEAERRFNVRSAIMDAYAIRTECDRMKHLASDLKINYQSLAVFSGASGGSRDEMYQKAGYEKYEHARKISAPAVELIAAPKSLDEIDDQELDQMKIKLAATLLELTALREQMADELSDIRLQNSEARNTRLTQLFNRQN
jgi:hypothetical protein